MKFDIDKGWWQCLSSVISVTELTVNAASWCVFGRHFLVPSGMVNCRKFVYIYLYSPTVDNTFLCLFCSTCFGDYTTITVRSSCSLRSTLVYLHCRLFTYDTVVTLFLGIKS
jgi:hypothetical protein